MASGIRRVAIDFLGNVIGEDVSPAKAKDLTESAEKCRWMEVARAVLESYIINALQMCDIRIYRSGDGPESTDHEAWLWNVSPNPNQSRADFMADVLHDAMHNEAGALVVPVRRGRTTHLYHADGFSLEERPGRPNVFSHVSIEGSTEVAKKTYTADQVYHISLMTCPGWQRLFKLVADQYQELGGQAHDAFRDSTATRYKLVTEVPITQSGKQMEAIADYIDGSLKTFVRGQRGILPVYKGFDLVRLQGASNAASWRRSEDVIALRQDMFDAVAACLHIPTSMIYGNTNNFESVMTSFLTFGVDPVARVLEDEIARKTLTEDEWAAGGEVVVDTTKVKHIELFDVADKVEKLVGSSVDNPNEIRTFTRQRAVDKPGMNDYQRTKNHEGVGGGE